MMDPEKRLTCKELLEHSYFDDYKEKNEKEVKPEKMVKRPRAKDKSRVSITYGLSQERQQLCIFVMKLELQYLRYSVSRLVTIL